MLYDPSRMVDTAREILPRYTINTQQIIDEIHQTNFFDMRTEKTQDGSNLSSKSLIVTKSAFAKMLADGLKVSFGLLVCAFMKKLSKP